MHHVNDLCNMPYNFIGEDGLPHSVHCILDHDHASRISQVHQDASGFTWVKNVFAAVHRTN